MEGEGGYDVVLNSNTPEVFNQILSKHLFIAYLFCNQYLCRIGHGVC